MIPEEIIQLVERRIALREMSADEFVEQHASGTLRKNKKLGMRWRDQYLVERTAYEFGWGFECVPRSRVIYGDAYTEGDCRALTEAGWHAERYSSMTIFPDKVETKYIHVEEPGGSRREGIGLIIRSTTASFVPDSYIIFAIIAEFHPEQKRWGEPHNPF